MALCVKTVADSWATRNYAHTNPAVIGQESLWLTGIVLLSLGLGLRLGLGIVLLRLGLGLGIVAKYDDYQGANQDTWEAWPGGFHNNASWEQEEFSKGSRFDPGLPQT